MPRCSRDTSQLANVDCMKIDQLPEKCFDISQVKNANDSGATMVRRQPWVSFRKQRGRMVRSLKKERKERKKKRRKRKKGNGKRLRQKAKVVFSISK